MSDNLDDRELIDACRAGDKEAYGLLVRRHQDRLYPTALRLAGCAEGAHDLLQDAFLRGFEKLAHFQGESSFYTWIYRITVNLALSDRRRRRPLLGFGTGVRGMASEAASDVRETDPSLSLERAEREKLIQDALNALAPDHRVVVVMKEFDGLRYDEIALHLGVPIGTVRSRLHRARTELREKLRGLVDAEATPERQAVSGPL